MQKRKKIIFIFASLLVIILLFVGYNLDQSTKNSEFKQSVMSVYNSHNVLANDADVIIKNMKGRSYDNLFSDLNEIKKKNQDLKMKAAGMNPKTKESDVIKQQLEETLNTFDASITSIVSYLEIERVYQMTSTFEPNGAKIKEDEQKLTEANNKAKSDIDTFINTRSQLYKSLGIAPSSSVQSQSSSQTQ